MVHHVNLNHPIQVAAWAAVVLGFHLLPRKSNLVPNTALEFSPLHQLVCKDTHFHRCLVLVNIKWSKSHQIGNRVTMPLFKKQKSCMPSDSFKEAVPRSSGSSPATFICLSVYQTLLPLSLVCAHLSIINALPEEVA